MGLLSGITVMVVDTETTGFSPAKGDRVVAVACTSIVDGVLQDTWTRRVNPGRPIPAGASNVHGIYDKDVANEPPASEIGVTLRALLQDHALACHNAPFDLPFLGQMFIESRQAALTGPVVDTLGLARGLRPGKDNSLRALAAEVGMTQKDGKHQADEDTVITARLLLKFADQWERERGIRTFDELAAVSQDIERATRRR